MEHHEYSPDLQCVYIEGGRVCYKGKDAPVHQKPLADVMPPYCGWCGARFRDHGHDDGCPRPDAVLPTMHEQAAAALLDPYLADDPPEQWHLIDNADADDVRHALEVAIERLRALPLAICRWHHGHRGGDPVPCVQAKTEATAIYSLIVKR